jgi:hypothetical protein
MDAKWPIRCKIQVRSQASVMEHCRDDVSSLSKGGIGEEKGGRRGGGDSDEEEEVKELEEEEQDGAVVDVKLGVKGG